MDNQPHVIPPNPAYKGKLDKTSHIWNAYSTFIFEPTDLVPFEMGWMWQKNWRQNLLTNKDDHQAIWILQHPCCYTLGTASKEANVLFDLKKPPWPLYRIDRGGEVTHHTPGQLVVYPVLDLRNYKKDLDWYLRQLEEVLIEVLKELNLSGKRKKGLTGIWIEGIKVGSIGIGCRRWITQHGLALNVDCDLNGFTNILPCGLSQHPVGKLDSWLPGLTSKEVQPLIRKCLIKRFNLSVKE